ncbi:metallophosphoesterase [soil metagenome]
MRRLLQAFGLLLAVGMAVMTYAFLEARRDPVVRRGVIALPRWPAGQPPIRVVLLSDIHIGSLVSDAPRLRRIVAQIDALKPDLVLIAGDFIFGERADRAEQHAPALVAPLKALRARLGVIAVPGNHDHETGMPAVARALSAAGITLLQNRAIVVGPLAFGGIDDTVTGHARGIYTTAQMRILPGARVLMTHAPDIARNLAPDMPLLLAGHTHCGQIVLPWFGPIANITKPPYQCGLVRDGKRTVVITAGIGATGVPFRLGAPPDLLLLTLGPKPER